MTIRDLFFCALLLAAPLCAQEPKPADVQRMTRPQNHWGTLQSVKIPKTCKHVYPMRGKSTCRVYLRFPQSLRGRLNFRVWDTDDPEGEDSLYRIFLTQATVNDPRGIYVQGVVGHTIDVEVTSRY